MAATEQILPVTMPGFRELPPCCLVLAVTGWMMCLAFVLTMQLILDSDRGPYDLGLPWDGALRRCGPCIRRFVGIVLFSSTFILFVSPTLSDLISTLLSAQRRGLTDNTHRFV
jgi:hypothetical protein